MKYLRVDIEGCVQSCCDHPFFTPLDGVTEYTEADLAEIAQDMANEQHSYGYTVVDYADVPERER